MTAAARCQPAYSPIGPPVRCMTPGHEDRTARLYPGGYLCKDCLDKASHYRQAVKNLAGLECVRPEQAELDFAAE